MHEKQIILLNVLRISAQNKNEANNKILKNKLSACNYRPKHKFKKKKKKNEFLFTYRPIF
jgi:hypothetical protein